MKRVIRNATHTNKNRQRILDALAQVYPTAAIALSYRTPWELLVAVMLSAQCTDKKVNEVTKVLFQKFPTVEAVASADIHALEQYIFSTGFYHAKAAHIQKTARIILQKHHGVVPKTLADLTALHGVGRKTAHIVLANAYKIASGIPVDTHVSRIAQRLRLVTIDTIGAGSPVWIAKNTKKILDYYKHPNTDKIEKELCAQIPKSQWNTVSYQFIEHGRSVCRAIRPQCLSCQLAPFCPVSR